MDSSTEILTPHVELLMMLLSNVTVSDPAFKQLLQLRALNNCAPCMQREDAVQKLTELKVVGRIMDYLTEGLSLHVELLMMLLSNVTVSDPACEQLLQLKTRSVTGFNM